MLSRRSILHLSAALATAGLAGGPAGAQAPLAGSLLQPGPLPEKTSGSPTAPVTVIQYASLTCHHGMNFHIKTWPALKEKYVETGKVRFIMREFPLDPLAAAGFMLARLWPAQRCREHALLDRDLQPDCHDLRERDRPQNHAWKDEGEPGEEQALAEENRIARDGEGAGLDDPADFALGAADPPGRAHMPLRASCEAGSGDDQSQADPVEDGRAQGRRERIAGEWVADDGS